MKKFAELFSALDQTNKTGEKIEIIADYFSGSDDSDKLWTLYLFSGGKIRKKINLSKLREWAVEYSGLPDWLFNESYHSVGDLAETIALILPSPSGQSDMSLSEWIEYIESANSFSEAKRKEFINDAWKNLSQNERFVFNKLLTGSFRVGVSRKTIINALSRLENIDENVIAHRLAGDWHPSKTTYEDLLKKEIQNTDVSKPYPFFLAYSVEGDPANLGDPSEWIAEWKWDGIRGQLIHRNNELYLWSRGEEIVTNKFPEFNSVRAFIPNGIVLDGEILCYADDHPLSFNLLQTRIGRKNITSKILKDAPVVFMIYDILEYQGIDMRTKSLDERKRVLVAMKESLLKLNVFKFSDGLIFETWDELRLIREGSRIKSAEGVMLKRRNSHYQAGRKKGSWWKWKTDPYTIDGVLVYAQKGHGRRADLFTDYTFAVWDNGSLVSFAKAYSGLTDQEIREVDLFVRSNTIEKFGPVRTVKPELVFELAFEGIAESGRHKSGIALRFPRISRWRRDKKIEDADSVETLKQLLNANQ